MSFAHAFAASLLRLVFAFMLVMPAVQCAAGDGSADTVLRRLQKQFPAFTPIPGSEASGDLNGDGIPDVAVLLDEPLKNAEPPARSVKVAVLFGTPQGDFRHFATSGDVFPHERVEVALEIRASSLFIVRTGSGGCCSRWRESFQFSMRRGDLFLIGEENASFGTGETVGPDDGRSINYLTHRAVFWKTVGKKTARFPRAFTPLPPTALRAFNYEQHSDRQRAELRAYVDDQLRLRPAQ